MTVAGRVVFVDFGLVVDVGVEGKNINVFVGLAATTRVFVAEETAVDTGEAVDVNAGSVVPVTVAAPGVRNSLIQTGSVRMAASTGSMNPLGRRVRKSLFGSRCDSMLVFNSQPGEKRAASCPAMTTSTNPITRIVMTTSVQSSRSRSIVFMIWSPDGQSNKDSGSGAGGFVVPGAFQPDAPAVCLDNAACDGEP